MSNGLVSVIVPFFNSARFLEEAIESVLAQSYSDWELLLLDDGSTDASSDIALRYAARLTGRVRYLEHPGHCNRGLSATRNLGLGNARGNYIALLDSDDVWLPPKLERQVDLLQKHPEASLIYGRSEYWTSWNQERTGAPDDEVPELGVCIPLDTLIRPPDLLILNYPLGLAAAPPPSDLMFRRSLLQRIGGFEESFRGIHQMYEDQVFLTKCYLNEGVYVSHECWDRYRQHEQSLGAVGEREGHYETTRRFFLEWLRDYLRRQPRVAPNVWQALLLAQWPYLPNSERRDAEAEIRSRAGRGSTASASAAGGVASYEGCHDVASCDEISGWAWDARQPDVPVEVEIYADDSLTLRLTANRFRRDLREAGKGDGYHAFVTRLPPWLRDGKQHRLLVKIAGSSFELASSPRDVTCTGFA